MTLRRYGSPEAVRTAVTARLRADAAQGPWRLGDLQRQYAYDQLVERLYRVDDGWVIKGATALLARRVSVRHTMDIDVYRAGAIVEVERTAREAARLDIGDWMRFETGSSARVHAAGAQAARMKVTAYIGTKIWAPFQIDIVADGIEMLGEPDTVPPLTGIEPLEQERIHWRAYPLTDHVADKVCAILERHDDRPSTRFKDLIDLVAIAQRASVPAAPQVAALAKEARRRHLDLPPAFAIPDRRLWERGYRAEARRTVGLAETTLDAAITAIHPFLDPLLDQTADGKWDPHKQRWSQILTR